MAQPAEASRPSATRLVVFGAIALVLVVVLGLGARLAHTATIPNVGLPVSNSKNLPNVHTYDPQVEATKQYLLAQGVAAPLAVWPDDPISTRAEYDNRRHRFLLRQTDGQWTVDSELQLNSDLPVAPSLGAAMSQYVNHRAGKIWANSVELLRQEGFEGGQLLLFSYIEPRPPGSLSAGRIAVLTYYVNAGDGWHFQGGGTGLPAAMNTADVSLGFTAFGPEQRYTAYYGVVENTNAVRLTFEEPSGARHTQNVKGQRTVLFLNERNPFAELPVGQPFRAINVKDVYGNNLRASPESPP